MPSVYIHWISRYDYEPGWQLDTHDHPYCQIIHIADGFGTFYRSGSRIMSAALGYNISYLCHAFKKACGITLMRYLYEYRINRARELIRDTDYSLKHIAAITGFRSIHHFCRVFTEITGKTPGSFRESERFGICREIFVEEGERNVVYIREKAAREGRL